MQSICVISEKAERLIAEAASYGSQLVVFPEAFIGGYPRGSTFGVTIGSRSTKGKEDFRKYYASAIDVPGNDDKRVNFFYTAFVFHATFLLLVYFLLLNLALG